MNTYKHCTELQSTYIFLQLHTKHLPKCTFHASSFKKFQVIWIIQYVFRLLTLTNAIKRNRYPQKGKNPQMLVCQVSFSGSVISVRTHRTPHLVILIAIIYYNGRIQSKINKGKSTRGENWGKPGARFQNMSHWRHRGHT